MIVGTAGHIDHGKTTLVKALTGVDTDRLPEEKKRGISIELGYAFLPGAGGERIAFIDVPGHERLVHTMLAGATGMDLALLLVAADDGVMPQTREHLAVLSLLGLRQGAVVITMCDRVEPARLDEVQAQVQALTQGSALQGAPLFRVSAHSGEGVAALREHLQQAAAALARPVSPEQGFRIAVDRVFSLDGVGTVLTGTVHAGQVRIGDELALAPDARGRQARVRSLHAQNQAVEQAGPGQRCAIGLVGLDKDEIARGQWLVSPGLALASDRLDVSLTLWHEEARPLRSGTPVHVHLGAATVMASVAVLASPDGEPLDALQPGGQAWVQLVLREPIAAWQGDRVVLRDASASRTLAGGVVLDPLAPQRYRRSAARLAELAVREAPPEQQPALWLPQAPLGLDLRRWLRAQGRLGGTPPPAAVQAADGDSLWLLDAGVVAALGERVRALLADFHARHPDELGPDAARLRRLAAPRLPEALWRQLLGQWREQGQVLQRGALVHLPEHGVRLSATEQRIAQKIMPSLLAAGFEGAWARDLARDHGEPDALMRTTLARLAQQGELHQVVKDLYLPPEHLRSLAAMVRDLAAAQDGEVLAAQFRDRSALGRKRAIQVLEYLDRVGLLRRVGDVHKLRAESTLFQD